MRKATLMATLLLAAIGCGHDPETGHRFQAERDIWNANQESKRLFIRPDLVEQAQWEDLARRYEEIANNHKKQNDTPAGADIDGLAARALISAAEVYRLLGDTTRMEAAYVRVEQEYKGTSAISAEASLARGRLDEQRGQVEQAIASYRSVLDLLEPNADEPGIGAVVLELPLRIARLGAQARGGDPEVSRDLYELPASIYRRWAEESPSELTRITASIYLADVDTDLRDWESAAGKLRRLEHQLAGMENPPRDPSALGFAIANSMMRAGAPVESTLAAFNSVVEKYPDSGVTARSLFALAEINSRMGRTEASLAHLKRIREEFTDDENLAARSLLLEAQVLEKAGRWPEAHEILQSLPIQHPLSGPAMVAPLEVALHYQRTGDAEGEKAALNKAVAAYREIIARYPSGQATFQAREKLAQVLSQQEKHVEALEEFLQLADFQRASLNGASYLVTAASIAYNSIGDTLRAAEILELAASRYGSHSVGKWAEMRSAELRAGITP